MSLAEQHLQLASADGTAIPATLVNPPGAAAYALLLHGFGMNRDEYRGLYAEAARILADHGIGSLRLDFRGHGESRVPQRAFTVTSQRADTQAAIAFLRRHHPSARLVVWGTSFGAPPAVFAAAENRDIAGIFLLSPVLDYIRTYFEPTTDWARQCFSAEALAAAEREGFLRRPSGFEMGLPLLREMRELDPAGTVKQLSCRIALLHGLEDDIVPFGLSQEVAADAAVELVALPRTGHGYSASGDATGSSPRSLRNRQRLIAAFVGFAQHPAGIARP